VIKLYVDADETRESLSPGACIQVGDALVVVTPRPPGGRKKFTRRYVVDALRLVRAALRRGARPKAALPVSAARGS
jgi:hypothetical protein